MGKLELPFTDMKIEVFTYKSLAKCLDACGLSQKRYTASYRKRRCFGFCRGKSEVHLWISKKATKEQVVGLVAHELGHMARPFRQDRKYEEIKTGRYEVIAKTAFNIATDLFKEPSC